MPQNLEGKYSIEILSPVGALIADFSGRARERQISMARNGSYKAEWRVDLDTLEQYARAVKVNARSLFSEGQNQARIKRFNVPLLSGQIEFTEGDLGEEKDVSIRLVGWLDLFGTRQTTIEKIFPAGTAIGQIALTALMESQALTNGSYGITEGTIQTTPTIPVDVLLEFKNLKELFQQLSERFNGIDFEFTHDKKFNVFYPRMGVQRNEFEFTYPGNVKNIKPSRDSSTIRNYAVVRGQGIGEGQYVTESEDLTSQTSYKLRQDIFDFSDIPDMDTLQALGDEQIRILKDPLEILTLTLDGNKRPFIGEYSLGDSVKVSILNSQLYSYVAGYYRIDEITIKIDEEDNEEIELKVSKQ